MNLMECHEFRELLLFSSPYLIDKSIPHRTKMTTLVVKGYQEAYQTMMEDIRVSTLA
jgi:hypothetical protein